MRITFRDPLPQNSTQEDSSFDLTASFWDDSTDGWQADTPTTVKYRVDCLTTGNTMRDWTTVSPSTSVTISLTYADNDFKDQANDRELRQVTVKADSGLSTQYMDRFTYYVKNNAALTS